MAGLDRALWAPVILDLCAVLGAVDVRVGWRRQMRGVLSFILLAPRSTPLYISFSAEGFSLPTLAHQPKLSKVANIESGFIGY